MTMTKIIKALSLFLGLEILNVVAHSIIRPLVSYPIVIDIWAFIVTMIMVFFSAKTILSRYPGSKKIALLSGFVFWSLSSLIISPILGILGPLGSDSATLQSLFVAYVLPLPLVLIVTLLAAATKQKNSN